MAPPGARPHRAAALAQALGGRLHGPDAWVSGVASWSRAGPDDLVFAEAALPESCGAGLVLARSALPGRSVIIVEDPRLSFILAIDILCPQRDVPGIHDSATVHPSARLGQGLTLHAGVVIGADCEIGDGCVLFPNVVLYPRTVLGRRVRIHAGAVLGADGFSYHQSPTGLHKMPQLGRVVVGDDVEIGANACIDRGALDDTVIGAGAKIDNLVQVGHNCQIGPGAILAAQVGLSGSVVLGEGVLLGGQVGVADHRRIGAGAQVGAQSGVSKDLPGAARYFGTPALPIARARRMAAALRLLPDQLRGTRRRREDPESE